MASSFSSLPVVLRVKVLVTVDERWGIGGLDPPGLTGLVGVDIVLTNFLLFAVCCLFALLRKKKKKKSDVI